MWRTVQEYNQCKLCLTSATRWRQHSRFYITSLQRKTVFMLLPLCGWESCENQMFTAVEQMFTVWQYSCVWLCVCGDTHTQTAVFIFFNVFSVKKQHDDKLQPQETETLIIKTTEPEPVSAAVRQHKGPFSSYCTVDRMWGEPGFILTERSISRLRFWLRAQNTLTVQMLRESFQYILCHYLSLFRLFHFVVYYFFTYAFYWHSKHLTFIIFM